MFTLTTLRLTTLHAWVPPLLVCVALLALPSCRREPARARTFSSPEEAVKAMASALTNEKIADVRQIFGPEGKDLIDDSDPASARRGREIFTAAFTERWKLVDRDGGGKTLVIGNEDWPFPVPLVQAAQGWHFDAAAGKEEVISRRIGRNELAVIAVCQTYVVAQRRYARTAHDGKRPGLFATAFRSDPGKQNGLYWAVQKGEPRSPLGDLLAEAADPARLASDAAKPPPFYGYYFKILTAQGPSATGGARNYVVNGEMSDGYALVAWPAQYDGTGVMTFIVNQDGIVREKDLGPETDAVARAMTTYEPDPSWTFAR
jgi:Protein of unknown function (DUF2950)